jgi:hypothetical protein
MTNTQGWLLALQGIVTVVAAVYFGYELLKARQQRLRYELYDVRDELIYLVATDALRQDGYLFSVFYKAITRSINEIQDLTLWSFVKASITAKSALEKEAAQRLRDEITAASPEVQRVVVKFAQTMVHIVLANSPFFVVFLRLVKLSHHWSESSWKASRAVGNLLLWRLLPGARERYTTYKYFDSFYDHDHPIAA